MQFLFIVTYGRTGSTALQMALNALPGYCIRGENGGILEHFSAALLAVSDGQDHPSRSTTTSDHPWFGIENANIANIRRELANLFTENILQPPSDCRVAGFKEIRYARLDDDRFFALLDFAQSAFDAKFIFLTRDPRDTARSGFWNDHFGAARKLKKMHLRLTKASKKYPSFIIDHSAFSQNPDGIAPLIEWLGEDPTPAIAVLSRRLTHLSSWNKRSNSHNLYRKIRKIMHPNLWT